MILTAITNFYIAFFHFASESPFLTFFLAPFWFILLLAPFITISEIVTSLIEAFTKKSKGEKK